MSRPLECRWTESEMIDEPAFSRRADFGSKKSGSRPTSCTGQVVVLGVWPVSAASPNGSVGSSSSFCSSGRVCQIMWWKT